VQLRGSLGLLVRLWINLKSYILGLH
jgi:hypothetical protein